MTNKLSNAAMASKANEFGIEAGFVANVILTQHTKANAKLRGLLQILQAGYEVRTGQFAIDVLIINGKQQGWEVLESPRLITNGLWA
jgi:hypothetical protein